MTHPSEAPASEPPSSVEDVAVLAGGTLLRGLAPGDVRAILQHFDQVAFTKGTVLATEHEPGEQLYVLLEGRARVTRKQVELRELGPGDCFGGLSLVGATQGAATVEAATTLRLARLPRTRYDVLSREHPQLALHIALALARLLAGEIDAIADSLGSLLLERSLPRRAEVHVNVDGVARTVPTGVRLDTLLPVETAGAKVMGALVNGKPATLSMPVLSDVTITPLTLRSQEGFEIYRRSACLLLLEAAATMHPEIELGFSAPVGSSQVVRVRTPKVDHAELGRTLTRAMRHLAADDVAFRDELWSTDEARNFFSERGWRDAALLLRIERESTVVLVTCGHVYAREPGPMLPRAGLVKSFRIREHPDGLLLDLDHALHESDPVLAGTLGGLTAREPQSPRFGGAMALEHRAWLGAMGIESVGSFNDACVSVSGQVNQLVRVAEGFHEKHIGKIADVIAARRDQVRVICVAGPSSSGKTTFIKRLTVQMEIDGIRPVGLSLDDYYVDRDKTPRDESGAYDFEAVAAVDLDMLHAQVRGLLAGEQVQTARFDFLLGKSMPGGGKTVSMGPTDMLLLEGIHGLNPAILDEIVPREQIFNIFVHPANTLPLDRLTPVSSEEVRLLRRLVRDRHMRGYHAADTILRWPAVVRGDALHIYPFQHRADVIFDSSLVYEMSVLKAFAERYLLEVPEGHPSYAMALRLRMLLDRFVTIYPERVPPTSLLREFIGGSGFEY